MVVWQGLLRMDNAAEGSSVSASGKLSRQVAFADEFTALGGVTSVGQWSACAEA